jgi:hypothetical protein
VALDKALREASEDHGISAAWVAEYALHCSPGQLSKYRNPEDHDALPAHAYAAVYQATGSLHLLRQLVAQHGLELAVPEHHPSSDPESLMRLMGSLSRTLGHAVDQVLQALDPDSPGGTEITAEERSAIYPEICRLEGQVQRLKEVLHPRRVA